MAPRTIDDQIAAAGLAGVSPQEARARACAALEKAGCGPTLGQRLSIVLDGQPLNVARAAARADIERFNATLAAEQVAQEEEK